MPLRIVGVDTQTPVQNLQLPPGQLASVPDTTQASIAQGDRAQLQGIQAVNESTVQVANDAIAVQRNTSNTQRSGFGGLLDTVETFTKLYKTYNDITVGKEQQEAKRQQAEAQARGERTKTQVVSQVEEARLNLASTVRTLGVEKGIQAVQSFVNTTIMANPDLDEGSKQELVKVLYGSLREVSTQQNEELSRQNKEVRSVTVENEFQDGRLRFTQQATALAEGVDADNPEAWNNFFGGISSYVSELEKSGKFTPIEIGQIRAKLLDSVLPDVKKSQAGKSAHALAVQEHTDWSAELSQTKALLESDVLSYSEYSQLRDAINVKYKKPSGADVAGSMENLDYSSNLLSKKLALQDAVEKNFLKNEDVPMLEQANVTEQAMNLLLNPGDEYKYTKLKTADSQRVLATRDRLRELQGKLVGAPSQIAGIQTQLSRIQGQIQQSQIWLSKSPDELARAKEAGIQIPDPTQIVVLQQQQQALQQELQVKSDEYRNYQNQAASLGVVLSSDGQFGLDPRLKEQLNMVNQKVQSGELQSNFRQGGLASQTPAKPVATFKHNGAEMLIPFATNDSNRVTFTSGFGTRVHPVLGTSKHHDGIDLAAPKGTPITSLLTGEVVRSTYDDGFGHYIEVKQQDGKHVLYAHLDGASPLKVGQQVQQGQVIGKVGSSGRSTGPHLHLGVYEGASGGGVDPLPYLTSLKKQGKRVARGLGLPPEQRVKPTAGNILLASQSPPQGAQLLPMGGYIWEGKLYLPQNRLSAIRKQQDTNGNIQFAGRSSGGALTPQGVESMLKGGGNSLIAKVIGMAEGNRRADGSFTEYYYGHLDPKNRAHNIGSFSAQGSLNRGDPVSSDQYVIDNLLRPRIRDFYEQAAKVGVKVTPLVLFNYLDAYAQSPLAAKEATSGVTFFSGLGELRGRENDHNAVAALRTKMYHSGGQYEIAGQPVEQDQGRRMGEINKAIQAFSSQLPTEMTAPERFGATTTTPQQVRTVQKVYASGDAAKYTHTPNGNYGYRDLLKDNKLTKQLNLAAKRANIPGQWLADATALFTGGTFSPAVARKGNQAGVIPMFAPELQRFGIEFDKFAVMPAHQQMGVVSRVLEQEAKRKPFKRVEDFAAFLWGGQSFRNLPDTERVKGVNGQGYMQFISRLGEYAGREYDTRLKRLQSKANR